VNNFSLELSLLRIPAILIAITIHEFAHGWVALLSGDATARNQGRLTLNPLAHLDPLGALMMFFGPFGWARPVPVNPNNFRNRRRDMILVAAAGPVSNMACAVVCGWAIRGIMAFQPPLFTNTYFIIFLQLCFLLSVGLSFFNLIPIPPLDGSNIVAALLPPSKIPSYANVVRHAPKVLLGMLLVEWLFKVPVFSFVFNPVFNPYLHFWQWVALGGKDFGL
jgi:Zn-dependent protease